RPASRDVVTSYDGYIGRAVGDEVLVYFGYPRAHEDDAERAVRASLAVIKAVRELTVRPQKLLQTRIGMATGLVIIGDLKGAAGTSDHAAVRGAFTLANGLLALAEPGSFVISPSTRRLTGVLFE